MIRVEGGLPEFRVGRVMLTERELAGLAACEAANRTSAWVENDQKWEDSPHFIYVGKKPTRQRFVLRHGTKPDPETGTQILTKMPHRHTSYEELVARHRRYRRAEGSFRGRFKVEKPYIPGWRLRAPEICDEYLSR